MKHSTHSSYSLTHAGILVSVIGTAVMNWLVQSGVPEAVAQELWGFIVQLAPVAVGGAMSWVGRVRAGGVTTLGFKK